MKLNTLFYDIPIFSEMICKGLIYQELIGCSYLCCTAGLMADDGS